MILRDAGSGDLENILALQKLCYRENARRYNDYAIQPLAQTIDDLQKEFSSRLVLVMEDDAGIIGSVRAYAANGVCHIGKLIVHPDRQNRGIGKQLMGEIEKRFDDVGRYELFTGHRDEKNIRLYTSLGYAKFREEKKNEQLTLIYMEKAAR